MSTKREQVDRQYDEGWERLVEGEGMRSALTSMFNEPQLAIVRSIYNIGFGDGRRSGLDWVADLDKRLLSKLQDHVTR